MTVETLLNDIRVYLNDSGKVEYQDSELITYLNDGLEYIEALLAERQSSITLSSLEYVSTPALLPDDFLMINKVVKDDTQFIYRERDLKISDYEYSIIGNQLIIKTIPATLYYFKMFERVTSVSDNIDIYKPLVRILKDFVIVKALNRLEYNSQVEQRELDKINMAIITIARQRDGMLTIKRYSNADSY